MIKLRNRMHVKQNTRWVGPISKVQTPNGLFLNPVIEFVMLCLLVRWTGNDLSQNPDHKNRFDGTPHKKKLVCAMPVKRVPQFKVRRQYLGQEDAPTLVFLQNKRGKCCLAGGFTIIVVASSVWIWIIFRCSSISHPKKVLYSDQNVWGPGLLLGG